MNTVSSAARLRTIGCFLLLAMLALGTWLQAQFKWPEKGENLKVLAESTTSDQLRETMIGFSQALGVRCNFCHLGEEGKPLTEFDFVSDDKEAKRAARVMMKMVEAINQTHLPKLGEEEHSTVSCVTCHRGLPEPEMLEDLLAEEVNKNGVAAARTRYQDLRKQHYGGFSYDFSEPVLRRLAQTLFVQRKIEESIAILQLNAEVYPNSWQTHAMMGEFYRQQGKKEDAVSSYEKSLEINPDNENLKRRLEALKKQ